MTLVRRHPLATYFVTAFVISWGGGLIVARLVGRSGLLLPMFLAMAAGPTTASLVLTLATEGPTGLRALRSRLTHWRLGWRWYAFLLLNPLLILVILGALSRVSPVFIPKVLVPGRAATAVGLAIIGGLAAGLFEELGWTGFATPHMLRRRSVLATGLTLGLLWSTWHVLPDLVGAAGAWGQLLVWRVLLWAFAGMTAYRVLMTWLYARTGSLLLAILMHAVYTGGQSLLEPPRAGQVENLLWWGLLAAGLWVAAGILIVLGTRGIVQGEARSARAA